MMKKLFKYCLYTTAIFIVVVGLIYLMLSSHTRWLEDNLNKQLSAKLEQDITIGDVALVFNWPKLAIKASKISIKSNQQSPITIGSVSADLALIQSIKSSTWRFDNVRITGAQFRAGSDQPPPNFALIQSWLAPLKLWLAISDITLLDSTLYFKKNYQIQKIALKLVADDVVVTTQIKQQVLALSDWYSQLPPALDMTATVRLNNQGLFVENLTIENEDFSANVTGQLITNSNLPFVLQAQSANVDTTKLKRYMPDKLLSKNLIRWFQQFFVAGKTGLMQLNLSATDFDSLSVKALVPVVANTLSIHPDWFVVNGVDGAVSFDNETMEITLDRAFFGDIALSEALITMADVSIAKPYLMVSGTFMGDSADFVDLLHTQQLLQANVGRYIEGLSLSGNATVAIDLAIPIRTGNDNPPSIAVRAQLGDNRLAIEKIKQPISVPSAALDFSDNALSVNGSVDFLSNRLDAKLEKKPNKPLLMQFSNDKLATNLRYQDNTWQADFYHKSATGGLQVADDWQTPWQIYLDTLLLTPDDGASLTLSIDDLPAADIGIRHLEFASLTLNDVFLTVEKPSTNQLVFSSQIAQDGLTLDVQGQWQTGTTSITATLNALELSSLLAMLGVNSLTTGGEMTVVLNLFCHCYPWQINATNLKGDIVVKIGEGEFLDQGNMLARLLSLLNFRALAQRLHLDLSDVMTTHFQFQTIGIALKLANGRANVEDFALLSSSSYISIEGYSDLLNHHYHHKAVVYPKLSDSLPVLAYLSGSGLLGLGVWLIDEFIFDGSAFDRSVGFEYTITGPWADPIIK